MNIRKIFIAHSWTDVGVNIQTKAVAIKLSETTDVTFISQARIGKPEIIASDHLRVIEWPNKRPNSLKDFFFLIRQIRKERPDALIVHFGATNICMLASWLMGVKFRICWMHTLSSQYYLDLQQKSAARRAISIRAFAYRLATHVIVLNEHGKRDAVEGFKIKPHKLFKIYNGIQNSESKNTDKSFPYSIRYCGRLDKSKGTDILIKAFAKAYSTNPNLVLEIAGRGSEEENIRSVIKEAFPEGVVKMHGYFSDYTQAIKFISEAYCLVVPSRMDNFPTVILEAISNAIPVIASDIGGIPDMIEDGKEGILVKPERIEELSEAILKIAGNDLIRGRMATQAKLTFDKKFSMQQHVHNVIEFLDNLNNDSDRK